MTPFEHWWYHEGSQPPTAGYDLEEHCKRMCKIAWDNGAFKAREIVVHSLEKQAELAIDEWDRKWALEMASAVKKRSLP